MGTLRLTFFGPPRLERDGQPVSVTRRKAQALLSYLAATSQSHSRDHLATLFWPDGSQQRARGNLRRVLSDLKQALGENILMLEGETVELAGEELWCDVRQFRANLAA